VVSGSTTSAVDITVSPDSTAPASSVTSIVNGSTLTALSSIAGTAADDIGVSRLSLGVHDATSDQWWTGGQWISTTSVPYFLGMNPSESGTAHSLTWTLDTSTGGF